MDVMDVDQCASSRTTRTSRLPKTHGVAVSQKTDAAVVAQESGRRIGLLSPPPSDGPGTWDFAPGDQVTPSLRSMARLGGGRRCETWLCWSTQLLSPVAVKLGRPGTANERETARRLRAEAELVASIAHPCFQRVFGTNVEDDMPHIVFEYVEGP